MKIVRVIAFGFFVSLANLSGSLLHAQGCVAVHQSAPMVGAICAAGNDGNYSNSPVTTVPSGPSRWQVSIGYRWQDSFRHFRGDVEQKERLEQGTEVQNKLHLFDISVLYQLSPRWTVNFSAPFQKVDRISHRNGTHTQAAGIGDVLIGAKFWIFRPPTEGQQNIQMGFSLKLPTGNANTTNKIGKNTIAVDQSIQSGDGGTGFSVDFMTFKSIQRFTLYGTGLYLFNPKNKHLPSGTELVEPLPRNIGYLGFSSPGTEFSVSDQYLFSAGLGYAVPKLNGLAFTATSRWEGVPARDIIGREDGFRRPGYVVSVGPGIMYSRGRNTWSVSAPIAVRRDRTRSVSDVARGSHGDAAFADYIITANYSFAF